MYAYDDGLGDNLSATDGHCANKLQAGEKVTTGSIPRILATGTSVIGLAPRSKRRFSVPADSSAHRNEFAKPLRFI